MKAAIQSVKGTRDFYPEDMAIRHWFYEVIGKISGSFGYQEWEGPCLEKIDLYAAKSGEELVKEQAFVFQDRGGDDITLRPELTPTLARMVAQKQKGLLFPLRWWSFGPFWRYERPQKGRTREFFQWNIDLIGLNSPESDAELIAVCASFFKEVGLSSEQVKIHVNNRKLMDTELGKLGISTDNKAGVFRLIDRRDKMKKEQWTAYAEELGLSSEQVAGIDGLLQNKNLWEESADLCQIFEILEVMGFKEYIEYNAQIIRGLDYYTGVVFEARDQDGGRAILGGGRYDNLVEDVGGEPLSGVGFAMGDVMAKIILEKYKCIPDFPATPADILVTVFSEDYMKQSISLSSELRQAGLNVITYPSVVKLPKQLKFGDRMGVAFTIIIGPDEVETGKVTIKELGTGNQVTINKVEAGRYLSDKLAKAKSL